MYYVCARQLAVAGRGWCRNTDDGCVDNRGMREESGFELGRSDLEAADFNEFL